MESQPTRTVASHRSSSVCPVQPCGFRHTSLLCSLCAMEVIPACVGISMGGGERSAQSSVSREGFHERRHSRTPRYVWTCHPCPCSPLRGQGRSAPCHLRVPFHVTQSCEYLSPVHIGTFAPFFPLTTGTDSRSCPS